MKPSYEQLLEQLKDALAKIDALEAEIQELKEKLNTNSSNSSKPSSQDPFRKRKKSKASKRRQGAQKGHKGHSRQLIPISSGSVCKIHERASQILKDPYDEIKMHTLCQNHLNADETSWKTMTEKRWIWVGSSEHSVFFAIQATRSAQAFRNVFGAFQGGLTTDRYNAYNSHEGKRQLCWAHADRDFEKIAGRKGFDKWVGQGLLKCKEALFSLWHRFKDGEITRDDLIGEVEAGPKEDLKLLLKAGAAHEDCIHKTRATCYDFLHHFEMLWTFVYTESVEPTNNAAEQRLRHGVIWRKLSYGSQSHVGERFVERVMTVAMTLKLQSENTFEYFSQCFAALIKGGQSPPIFSK